MGKRNAGPNRPGRAEGRGAGQEAAALDAAQNRRGQEDQAVRRKQQQQGSDSARQGCVDTSTGESLETDRADRAIDHAGIGSGALWSVAHCLHARTCILLIPLNEERRHDRETSPGSLCLEALINRSIEPNPHRNLRRGLVRKPIGLTRSRRRWRRAIVLRGPALRCFGLVLLAA